MNLIEILLAYAVLTKRSGRKEADEFLIEVCEHLEIQKEVQLSVNDQGQLIDLERYPLRLTVKHVDGYEEQL